MSTDERARTTRRTLLVSAVGAAGVAVAGRLVKPDAAAAANGDPMTLGSANSASSVTALAITTDSSAFQITGTTSVANLAAVTNGGGGPALYGETATGPWATGGLTPGDTIGVSGGSGVTPTDLAPSWVAQTGVFGVGGVTDTSDSTGVWGEGDVGVYGFGGYAGVWGEGYRGVYGTAWADAGAGAVGVLASAPSTTQYALYASGKVKLSRSGRGSFSSGRSSLKITLAGVTTSTHVLAQLGTNRAGIYVQSVVPTAGSFTIYLNKTVPGTTYVHWVVLDA